MNFAHQRLHGILNGNPALERLHGLSTQSAQLGIAAAAEMLRTYDKVLLPTQSPEKARAAAVGVLAGFEERLPDWRIERERLRQVYEQQLNASVIADAERRAFDQATYRRLSAPEIIEVAKNENVNLRADESGQLIVIGNPSPLLRARLRLDRDAIVSVLRNGTAQEVF